MKKLLIIAVALISFGSIVSANQLANNKSIVAALGDEKVKVKLEELPQAVQTALKAEEFANTTIDAIYLVKCGADYYSIELKKGDQKLTVNLDKEGKKIEDKK